VISFLIVRPLLGAILQYDPLGGWIAISSGIAIVSLGLISVMSGLGLYTSY